MARGETYEEFVEKFKPKKTTDDCYTPPEVYEVIKDWACAEYGINENDIVRPFYPGGDFENFEYPDGCVVLDNPPFSILAKIKDFYIKRNIKFFLFAPTLTILSSDRSWGKWCALITNAQIIYENGANIATSFVTNLESDGLILKTAPTLYEKIKEQAAKMSTARSLPKYEYPPNVLTAAMVRNFSRYGVDFKVRAEDCVRVSRLDAQKQCEKMIFGKGLLLSEKATAEKAAAEKAMLKEQEARQKTGKIWKLSEREKEIIKNLKK